ATIYNLNSGTGQIVSSTGLSCSASTRIFVGYGLASGNVCGLSHPVWIGSPNTDIVTGITVYLDAGLTVPLTGQNFIGDTSGQVFNINNGNGIVGSSTGIFC